MRSSIAPTRQARPFTLLTENLLHLADFLLDFPAYLLALAFGFQVGIVRQLSCLLLNLTLHFVNLTCNLILSTWLHLVASSEMNSAQLFRRCDFELIAHVFLSGHAYSFGCQVALLLFRPHWPRSEERR